MLKNGIRTNRIGNYALAASVRKAYRPASAAADGSQPPEIRRERSDPGMLRLAVVRLGNPPAEGTDPGRAVAVRSHTDSDLLS